MPRPGCRWRLVTIGTHNSWKPGDVRGWRSRGHRIHSSGDYRNPPPISEHRGLRHRVENRSGPPVTIPRRLRETVGRAIIESFNETGHCIIAVSVSGQHAHALVELPDDANAIREIVGEAKRHSSRQIRADLPGRVWAGGGDFEAIKTREEQLRAYRYVVFKQGPGAWTWGIGERQSRL